MRYWVLEVVELDTGRFIVEGTEFEADVCPDRADEVSDVDTFGDVDGYATRAEADAARNGMQPHV